MIIQASLGVAFDNKDYEEFLRASKAYLEYDTTLAIANASVASAYSCLYAESGKEADNENARFYLAKAKQIDNDSEDMLTYYNMIEYRLQHRIIITREEFAKKFPNGWKP